MKFKSHHNHQLIKIYFQKYIRNKSKTHGTKNTDIRISPLQN